MDITLVNLNIYYVRYIDGAVVRQTQLALGPLYLVSVLEQAGISVDFRDYQLSERPDMFTPRALAEFLRDPAPVVGLSCMANLLPFVLYAMPFLKAAYPQVTFILGGVGPMSMEEQILRRVPEIEAVHRGEGEVSVPLLVRALRNNDSLDHVPNIFFRRGDRVVQTVRAPRVENLDALPLPAYHRIDFSRYTGHNIIASRGCPYPCTFCSIAPIWEHRTVSRSPEKIADEMEHMYREYGVRQFLFQDEFFMAGPKRAMAFASALAAKKIDNRYKAFARADLVDADSLKALADTGCAEIRFGIESGSDRILERIKKKFTAARAMEAVALAKKHIPGVDTFFIWGFPFETMDDFGESLLQMVAFRAMGVRVLPSLLTCLPQTPLYDEIKDSPLFRFCEHLLPEYMILGMEKRLSVRMTLDEEYRPLMDYIIANKKMFPGFFQYDLDNNVLPKLAMLEEFGFYNSDDVLTGAHEATPAQFVMQS